MLLVLLVFQHRVVSLVILINQHLHLPNFQTLLLLHLPLMCRIPSSSDHFSDSSNDTEITSAMHPLLLLDPLGEFSVDLGVWSLTGNYRRFLANI